MEASSFFTCKPFNKALDPVATTRSVAMAVFYGKRPGRRLHGFGSRPSPSAVVVSCSQRQQLPDEDDNREPAIGSDWRSFRAHLVAGEQPSGPLAASMPPPPLTDKWAHPLHEAERGCLLVATEKLDGVHIFERTVVLLLSVGPLGPAGVILNRPSLMSIKETRSADLDVVAGTFADRPLFFGGPLEDGVFLAKGSEAMRRSGAFEEVMEGVHYGTKESVGLAAEMVKRGAAAAGDFRFFDGYCGWEGQQLREEVRAGYWTVAACSAGVIGLAGPGSAGLWEEVLGLVGEKKVF